MGLGPELLNRLMESRTTVNSLDMVIYIRNKQTMIDAKCIYYIYIYTCIYSWMHDDRPDTTPHPSPLVQTKD